MKKIILGLFFIQLLGCGSRSNQFIKELEFNLSENIQYENLIVEAYSISNNFNLDLIGQGSLEDSTIYFNGSGSDYILIKAVGGSQNDPVTQKSIQFDQENSFTAIYSAQELKQAQFNLNINFLTSLQTIFIEKVSENTSISNAVAIVREQTNQFFNFDIVNSKVGTLLLNAGNISDDDLYIFALSGISSLCAKISVYNQLTPGQTFTPIELLKILKEDFKDHIINGSNFQNEINFRDHVFNRNFRNEFIDGVLQVALDSELNKTNLSPIDFINWFSHLENQDNELFSHSTETFFSQNIFHQSHTVLQPFENEYFSEWINVEVSADVNMKILSWVTNAGMPIDIKLNENNVFSGEFYSNILEDDEYNLYTASIGSNGQYQIKQKQLHILNTDPIINIYFDYNLDDSIVKQPIFEDISLRDSFFLTYEIESELDLELVDITINGNDLNLSNRTDKIRTQWVDFASLGVDGHYQLNFDVIDSAGNHTTKSVNVRKNFNIYESESTIPLNKYGEIYRSQIKSYEIGDINQDGYSDVFLHTDLKPKVILGPNFNTVWEISEEDWFSSASRCDVNGDQISDIVVGNSLSTPNGKIKVFFGPMLSEMNFSSEIEYIGEYNNLSFQSFYSENAGAVLGCAKLSGGQSDQILHFNGNKIFLNSIVTIPSELQIINYNELNHQLIFTPSTQLGLLALDYPQGIYGNQFSSFSNAKDINNDLYEDIILNGWFDPSIGWDLMLVSSLFGGSQNNYQIDSIDFVRHKRLDVSQVHTQENAFLEFNGNILEDVNQDGFNDIFYSASNCSNQNACFETTHLIENDYIFSHGVSLYFDSYIAGYNQKAISTYSFDFDGDGSTEYVFFNRQQYAHDLYLDILYNQDSQREFQFYINELPTNVWATFTPVLEDNLQKTLFFTKWSSSNQYEAIIKRDIF